MSLSGAPPAAETAAVFAESLARNYAVRNSDIVPLFAAFVGLIFQRDESVGRDVLIALDRFVSAANE